MKVRLNSVTKRYDIRKAVLFERLYFFIQIPILQTPTARGK